MSTRLFTFTLAAFALCALGACSSESTGSTTTSGSGGSGSGTTGTGGAATGTGGAATGTGGGATGTGGAATGTGASTSTGTGGSDCNAKLTCGEALDGDPTQLCDGPSGNLYDKYYACACDPNGNCFEACGENACKGLDQTADCKACLQGTAVGANCSKEFNACTNDV